MANGKKVSTKKNSTGTKKAATTKKTAKVTNKTSSKQTAKKTNTKVNTVKNIQEPYVPTEKDIKIRNEIVLLIGLAVTILLMLANFGMLSPFGDYLAYFMFGLF